MHVLTGNNEIITANAKNWIELIKSVTIFEIDEKFHQVKFT